MSDISDLKSKTAKKLKLLTEIETLEDASKYIESGRKWINAADGENIGYANYYIFFEGITLKSKFMGYDTFKTKEIKFPDLLLSSEKLIDAFIEVIQKQIDEIEKELCKMEK